LLVKCAEALKRPVLSDRFLDSIHSKEDLLSALSEQSRLLQGQRGKKALPQDGVAAFFVNFNELSQSQKSGKQGADNKLPENFKFVPFVPKKLRV
jgi:hypothetical protein